MTPAARVQTAIELLDDILAGTPAEKALTGWARRSRFAGSKDRAAVRDHVFDALRRRNSAAAQGGSLTGRGLMIGVLRQDGVDVPTIFTGQTYAPAVLSDGEASDNVGEYSEDVPEWILPFMRSGLGSSFETSLDHLRRRAPVALRVNLRKGSVASARRKLQDERIETRGSDLAATALIVESGARKVAQSAAYRDGLVELQDASSQAAVAALPLENDMRVLDYCAGGGGKVLAMAGRAKARFFAHDADPGRMRDLPARAARAGVTVTQTEAPAGQAPYDLVLCDVPCSGSGTWRRTPDAKWRFQPADLDRLVGIQAGILDTASEFVAKGGVLAYATCSVLPQENRDQIADFLSRHEDWRCETQTQLPVSRDGDGFFFAVLTRNT
ncbi:RsmB/NOP family class I SAM-dependent RNA methyltransferase [Shimia aestuarii]|uniref:16S rRNA (Cytosine967-C5)-methyltransferase n=1 Tax=Shimia aestuarii TaxID=254406 RepID=A0A1I4P4J9_9RHOB|nr:RsmB/NOP family class I SAM-dependent RNA methyltransferase [Shimia aestuarii]SFM22669.1 16S rRNA (cytosine967-C5)-methyltransferase [Shimia aestuarii]